MLFLHIAFSLLINSQTLHLYSLSQNYNHIQKNNNAISLCFSNFALFSNSILSSLTRNSLNFQIQDSNFKYNHSTRPIILQSEELEIEDRKLYVSTDFKSPFISPTSAVLRSCTFNALSSTKGTPDRTTGGAFYSDGFQSTFINCTFTGNSAQKAAACAIFNGKAGFNLCRFFKNKANIDIGAILFDHCEVSISDSYFVENSAVLSIGSILAIQSSLNFEVVVFHMNHASYQTGALELIGTKATLNVNQFSNNICTREQGGVSIFATNLSYLTLTGCNFETYVEEDENKYPVVCDKQSYLVVKMNCFDATEEDFRSKIKENFVDNFNKFSQKCPCNHVSFDVPYDVTEINVEIQDKMLNPDFFGNVIAILVVTGCVLYYMLRKEEKNTFKRL